MKVLYVCSEFYAGLMPFGATIVNTMRGEDCFGVFVCSPKSDYRKSIVPNGSNYTFLDSPESKAKGLLHSMYPKRVLAAIKAQCKTNNIEAIHLLTEDASLAYHLNELKKQVKVYYTVHDLFFHEKVYKNALSWLMRKVLVQMRVKHLIKHADNLVTCSKFQYDWMQKNFKEQKSYFHNFPTLVTDTIKSGSKDVPELKGINNYILFFGQVEQYKGVDILYNTFISHPERTLGLQLVVAGKGHIYFERDPARETNVTFINRYIDDEELKDLFAKALCVVFPYISGTQSGILSLPYYFKVPSIVSGIPFFKEISLDNFTSYSFDIQQPETLIDKIEQIVEEGRGKLAENGYLYYQRIYDQAALRQQLLGIYF